MLNVRPLLKIETFSGSTGPSQNLLLLKLLYSSKIKFSIKSAKFPAIICVPL